MANTDITNEANQVSELVDTDVIGLMRGQDLYGLKARNISPESTQAEAEAGTDSQAANKTRMNPRRVRQAVEAQADKNVHVAAGSYASTSSDITNAEIIPYTDRAGTAVASLSALNWSDVQRVKIARRSAGEDPLKPSVTLNAVDSHAFFQRVIAEGLCEVFIQRYTSAFALDSSVDSTVVIEPISYADGVLDAYCYFARGTIGNRDTNSYRLSFRLPSRRYPIPGLEAAMSLPGYAKTDGSNLPQQGSDAAPSSLVVRVGSLLKRWSWANFLSRIKKALTGDRGFVSDVQSPSDPYTFTGAYTYRGHDPGNAPVNSDSQWNLNAIPVLNGPAKGIVIQFASADENAGVDRWLAGNEFVFGAARFKITGSVNKLSTRKYQATVQLVAGSEPAANATATPTLEPDSPHRSEFSSQAFASNPDSIGGKGGSEGDLWTRGSSDTNAGWAASPPATDTEHKTADYTAAPADNQHVLVFDGSDLTLTLPDITTEIQGRYGLWVVNSNTTALTIDGHGSDLVNGAASHSLQSGKSILLHAITSASWIILCGN